MDVRTSEPKCELSDDFSTFTGVLVSAWGVMLGDFDVDTFQEQAVDVILFFLFTFLISVLLLNLIIAVISEHHARVSNIRVHAWRESLAATIADVDLLMNFWCTNAKVLTASAKRCGDRQAHASAASERDIEYLSRIRRWKRLPIDKDACADETEVSWEADAPMITLALCTMVGAGVGAALGNEVGTHVGARSTGASVAIPIGGIAACVLCTGSVWSGWLLRKCWTRTAHFRLPAESVDRMPSDNIGEYDGRVHVATDCAMIIATAGAFCGALYSYSSAEMVVQGHFAPFVSGAAFGAVFCTIIAATRMPARTLFTLCVILTELILIVSVSVAIGACVAFFMPSELPPTHISRGGYVGGIVATVFFVVSWLGGVAATVSAFAWLWWPGCDFAPDELVMSVFGAGSTCALILIGHMLVGQVCQTGSQEASPSSAPSQAKARSSRASAKRGPPSAEGKKPPAVPFVSHVSSELAKMATVPAWVQNNTLHRTLALLSESRRTLHSIGRALLAEVLEKRDEILLHCAAASGGTAAALLSAPLFVTVASMKQEAQLAFRVLLGTCMVACGFLAVEVISGLKRSCKTRKVAAKPSAGQRRYVPLLEEGEPVVGSSDASSVKPSAQVPIAAFAGHAEHTHSSKDSRMRWVHVLATTPTELLGASRLSTELTD